MKRNEETGLFEADYVVVVRFQQTHDEVAQQIDEISSLLRHVPSYWSVSEGLPDRLARLFDKASILGSSLRYGLSLQAESEPALADIISELDEVVRTKASAGRKFLTNSVLLEVQCALSGVRETVLEQLAQLSSASEPIAAPGAKLAP